MGRWSTWSRSTALLPAFCLYSYLSGKIRRSSWGPFEPHSSKLRNDSVVSRGALSDIQPGPSVPTELTDSRSPIERSTIPGRYFLMGLVGCFHLSSLLLSGLALYCSVLLHRPFCNGRPCVSTTFFNLATLISIYSACLFILCSHSSSPFV
jgi:hypothetical protein